MRSTCGSCRGQPTSCRSSAMFESPFERRAVAVALYRRAAATLRRSNMSAAWPGSRIPAAEIRADRRYVQLRSRLERRPAGSRAFRSCRRPTSADLKPHVAVRTPEAFRLRLMAAALCALRSLLDRARVPAAGAAQRRSGGAAGRPDALRHRPDEPWWRCAIRCATRCPSSPRSPESSRGLALLVAGLARSTSKRRRCAARCSAPLGCALSCSRRCCCSSAAGRERAAQGQPARRAAGRGYPAARRARARRATSRDGSSCCASCSQQPTPSRPWLRHVQRARGGRTSGPASSAWRWCWRSSSCRRTSVRRWCSRASSWRSTAIATAAARSSFAGFGLRALRLRGRRTGSASRPRSGSAWRSGSIPGTTACPAATRSRMACGRWRPARCGAAGLAGQPALDARRTHRLRAGGCRRRARVRRAWRCSSRCTRCWLALPSRRGARARRLHRVARARHRARARRAGLRHRERRCSDCFRSPASSRRF